MSEDLAVTIGDLFRSDDSVARWCFAVTGAAEDLSRAEVPFRDALERPLRSDNFLRLSYYFRQLLARVFEARRPVVAATNQADVAHFVAATRGTSEPLDYLADVYIAGPGKARSKVEDQLGDPRNITIHHAWPDSDELRAALQRAAYLPARVLVDRRAGTLHYEWAEMVATRMVAGATNTPARLQRFRARVAMTHDIVQAYARLCRAVLDTQCARVGIDRAELIMEV
jgi:hypothetical protein